MIKKIESIKQWKNILADSKHKSLGFIPTMGALHNGHLSLCETALKENDLNIVSIYVNPTQFNNSNDLKTYPSSIEQDIQKLEEIGIEYVFTPSYEELYPHNYDIKITEDNFSKELCGADREGHFTGVLSVVMKFLNIIEADNAYFGEKDFQQYSLIKKMAESYFLKTNIIAAPTIREESGLAMSSRNLLLSDEAIKVAPNIFKLLNSDLSTNEIQSKLAKLGFAVDYVKEFNKRRYVAAKIENVRLIDNVQV